MAWATSDGDSSREVQGDMRGDPGKEMKGRSMTMQEQVHGKIL